MVVASVANKSRNFDFFVCSNPCVIIPYSAVTHHLFVPHFVSRSTFKHTKLPEIEKYLLARTFIYGGGGGGVKDRHATLSTKSALL